MELYNKLNKEQLEEQLQRENFERKTVSFYKYGQVENPTEFRDQLYIDMKKFHINGRIYVANEGINAQIDIPEINLEEFKSYINNHNYLSTVYLNYAIEENQYSFLKLRIIVKDKLVAEDLNNDEFDIYNVGQHLSAEEFNQKLETPNTVVVDLRNHYESEVGHFKGAILPDVYTYKESVPIIIDDLKAKNPDNVMLYCTGGIRCEKFSAYLRHEGFQNVFQLKGGIINYAKQVKENNIESKFVGKNFVFDNRLGERITDEVISQCHQCGVACDSHINCKNDACHLLFIQCPSCAEKYQQCCSDECKSVIQLSAQEQKKLRRGKVHANAHHKSRIRPKLKVQAKG